MRRTFPSASYPACGDDRMYDLHHGLLAEALHQQAVTQVAVADRQFVLVQHFHHRADDAGAGQDHVGPLGLERAYSSAGGSVNRRSTSGRPTSALNCWPCFSAASPSSNRPTTWFLRDSAASST